MNARTQSTSGTAGGTPAAPGVSPDAKPLPWYGRAIGHVTFWLGLICGLLIGLVKSPRSFCQCLVEHHRAQKQASQARRVESENAAVGYSLPSQVLKIAPNPRRSSAKGQRLRSHNPPNPIRQTFQPSTLN